VCKSGSDEKLQEELEIIRQQPAASSYNGVLLLFSFWWLCGNRAGLQQQHPYDDDGG
jgi:hypothetical protein